MDVEEGAKGDVGVEDEIYRLHNASFRISRFGVENSPEGAGGGVTEMGA